MSKQESSIKIHDLWAFITSVCDESLANPVCINVLKSVKNF